MTQNSKCLICETALDGRRTKFCCHKCAMKWHNRRAIWAERSDRAVHNARKRAAYAADPEGWAAKARAWRAANPEKHRIIETRSKERYWASPWMKMVNAARLRAKKKNLPFDLTFEWAEQRWTGFCELTGIPFSPRYNTSAGLFSPSIDKIDPKKGYVQSNSRFILFAVNNLKHDGTDEAMYLVAEALIANRTPILERRAAQVIAPEPRG